LNKSVPIPVAGIPHKKSSIAPCNIHFIPTQNILLVNSLGIKRL
jgi:hypothetical protein